MDKKTLGETRLSRAASSPLNEQCMIMIQMNIRQHYRSLLIRNNQNIIQFHLVKDWSHAGMEMGLLRISADEAFTGESLVDTSGPPSCLDTVDNMKPWNNQRD